MDNEKNQWKSILNTYWPLALSWLCMSIDSPIIAAVVNRMDDPAHCLAAHGGIVFPISLIAEAPIMMLISVSIALCGNKRNFSRLWKLMMGMSFVLTLIHGAIAFTPLFYVTVRDLIGAPEALWHYARVGLILMLPWTWAIAYRRFYQGVLIRFGYYKQVTAGTFVRLTFMSLTLCASFAMRRHISGAAAAGASLASGVMAEGIYAGIKGKKAARLHMPEGDSANLISWKALCAFILPLIMTQFINVGWVSIGSAAMSRMINPIASLAVWPVISGALSIVKSFGSAANETTLSVIQRAGYFPVMRKFILFITLISFSIFALIAWTPLNTIWFEKISSLSPALVTLAQSAFPLVFMVPIMNGFMNFYQAILLDNKKSNGILESLIVFLSVLIVFFVAGIALQRVEGIYVVMTGLSAAWVCQTLWMAFRARKFFPRYISQS